MTLLASGGRRRGSIFSDPLNVVVDGNSIWDNYYTAFGKFDQHLMQYEPLKSSGASIYCGALSGASWANLTARAPYHVDAKWVEGRNNVLIVNETVNSIQGGGSAATVKAAITTYLSGRLALHPWRIIYSKCPPWGGSAAFAGQLAIRSEVNAWAEANATTLGIERVVDLSSIPQFDHDGLLPAPFQAFAADWQEATGWLHPKDAPKLLWAELLVATMNDMPRVPPA